MRIGLYILSLLFISCGRNQYTIKVKGSDTEVNLVVRLAEAFHTTNPDFYVSISGGGSGLGIASLINGQADIANSSRTVNNEELNIFKRKEIGLDTFVFAEDAIAFVVAQDFPLDTIIAADLAKILSGEYDSWSALTKSKENINIYGRQSNSGTHDYVQKKLDITFSTHAREMNGNAQILEAIKADHSGIGYVGAGYVMSDASKKGASFKVLKIAAAKDSAAISPLDSVAISQNRYFFQRPLFQYIRAASAQKVNAFIEFEKSSRGLQIIRASGYYPPRKYNH